VQNATFGCSCTHEAGLKLQIAFVTMCNTAQTGPDPEGKGKVPFMAYCRCVCCVPVSQQHLSQAAKQAGRCLKMQLTKIEKLFEQPC